MSANAHFIAQHGGVRLAVTLAPFDTTMNALFDQRLLALKRHVEEDGLTAGEAISVLDSWAGVLRDATRQGKIDAFLASRTLTIIGMWIGQIEDAIRARLAA